MHWWRMRALEHGHGAFHAMRALVFSKNKPTLVRLIEAGGGVVVNANPPYTHNVDATHCFVDMKLRMAAADFVPLAEQGIPCLSVLYLSKYLNTRTNCNMKDFILPDLQPWSAVKREAWTWLLRDRNPEQTEAVAKKLSDEMDDKSEDEAEDTAAVPPAVIETPMELTLMAKESKQTEVTTKQDESETQVEVSGHIVHLHHMLSRRDSNSRSSLVLSDGTPKHNLADEFSEAEAGCSQDTPISMYIRGLKERKVLPSTLDTPVARHGAEAVEKKVLPNSGTNSGK